DAGRVVRVRVGDAREADDVRVAGHRDDGGDVVVAPRAQPDALRLRPGAGDDDRGGHGSVASLENMTRSTRPPLISAHERSTPSRWNPQRSATRWDAALSTCVV